MIRNQTQLSYQFPDLTPDQRPNAEQTIAGIVKSKIEAHNSAAPAPVKLTGVRWYDDNETLKLSIRFGSNVLSDLETFANDIQTAIQDIGQEMTVRLEHIGWLVPQRAAGAESESTEPQPVAAR